MSAVVSLALELPQGSVLRFLGYPEGREPPRLVRVRLLEVLEEARVQASGRGAWRTLPADRSDEVGLEPMEAAALVLGLVTAGPAIEARAAACLAGGDALGALLFDAAGSAAAEEAADRLGAHAVSTLTNTEIAANGARAGAAHVSCRVSPGYGRWKLSSQQAFFALLPGEEAGVRLLPSLLMTPRKSVSFAMWLGADARPLEGLSGCVRCELLACRYRRTR